MYRVLLAETLRSKFWCDIPLRHTQQLKAYQKFPDCCGPQKRRAEVRKQVFNALLVIYGVLSKSLVDTHSRFLVHESLAILDILVFASVFINYFYGVYNDSKFRNCHFGNVHLRWVIGSRDAIADSGRGVGTDLTHRDR